MQTRPLGRTGVELTVLGMGTWAIGAGKRRTSNLGPVDDEESVAAIHRALDLGINWIDTAAYYGFGHAERIVARALRGLRERPLVFTKCGLVPSEVADFENRITAASIREEAEASLARLETDVLDLLMIHWPIPDDDIEEGWSALADLKAAGKVRFIGVSNFSASQMARCELVAPIDAIQPEYSLVDRTAEEEVLPYAEKVGIGTVTYSPLKHGLLSGSMTRERVAALTPSDWRRGHEQYTEPKLSENLRLVDALREVAGRHGCTVSEVAIAWVLRRPAVTSAIVGPRRPEQLGDLVGAADLQLRDEDLATIEARLGIAPGAFR
ncbi:aldo/keto reductase [Geodermatophilus ruber]|uniref:Predicted oxidoreductase n=1 Tax=Geodermatophilus ruber TaxID=504800 RepID=A0A1I4G635_9ACTN|nr:aldo/keto reductase [Geodermatophilus ruber]SFL24571.1 Predicted oxidoreductase [Geodermatophilus ruber]